MSRVVAGPTALTGRDPDRDYAADFAEARRKTGLDEAVERATAERLPVIALPAGGR